MSAAPRHLARRALTASIGFACLATVSLISLGTSTAAGQTGQDKVTVTGAFHVSFTVGVCHATEEAHALAINISGTAAGQDLGSQVFVYAYGPVKAKSVKLATTKLWQVDFFNLHDWTWEGGYGQWGTSDTWTDRGSGTITVSDGGQWGTLNAVLPYKYSTYSSTSPKSAGEVEVKANWSSCYLPSS